MGEYEGAMTLTDLEGNEIDCEILDTFAYEGREYVILLPLDDDSDEPEAVILERVNSGKGEAEELRGIEDAQLLDAVFAIFLKRNQEMAD